MFCGDLVWNGMFPNYMDAIPTRLSAHCEALLADPAAAYVPGHGDIADYAGIRPFLDVIADVGAREGVETVLEFARSKKVRFGIIAAEENGSLAYGFTTEAMSWAFIRDGDLATFLAPSDGEAVKGDGGEASETEEDES